MNRYVFGFLVLAAASGAVLADDKTDAEIKKLEGNWEIESIEAMGKTFPAPKGKGGSFTFKKDMKVIHKNPGKKDETGTYKIDASKTPKELDLIEDKEDKKGEKMETIYEIDGDKLKLGFSAKGPKGKRPSAWDDKDTLIMHLKRQKD